MNNKMNNSPSPNQTQSDPEIRLSLHTSQPDFYRGMTRWTSFPWWVS